MEFAAQFWKSHKDLDILASDSNYSSLDYNRLIFVKFGVRDEKLRFIEAKY